MKVITSEPMADLEQYFKQEYTQYGDRYTHSCLPDFCFCFHTNPREDDR